MAAEVCLEPCALLRQTRVGTHAQRLGLWLHAAVRPQLGRMVSPAVVQRVAGSSRIRVIGDIGCVRPDFGGKGMREIGVLKMSPKR